MSKRRNRHRIWIRIVATVVVCLFTISTITWAYPPNNTSGNSYKLARWSLAQNLGIAGIQDKEAIVEAVHGIRHIADYREIGACPRTANSALNESSSAAGVDREITFLDEGFSSENGITRAKYEAEGRVYEVTYSHGNDEIKIIDIETGEVVYPYHEGKEAEPSQENEFATKSPAITRDKLEQHLRSKRPMFNSENKLLIPALESHIRKLCKEKGVKFELNRYGPLGNYYVNLRGVYSDYERGNIYGSMLSLMALIFAGCVASCDMRLGKKEELTKIELMMHNRFSIIPSFIIFLMFLYFNVNIPFLKYFPIVVFLYNVVYLFFRYKIVLAHELRHTYFALLIDSLLVNGHISSGEMHDLHNLVGDEIDSIKNVDNIFFSEFERLEKLIIDHIMEMRGNDRVSSLTSNLHTHEILLAKRQQGGDDLKTVMQITDELREQGWDDEEITRGIISELSESEILLSEDLKSSGILQKVDFLPPIHALEVLEHMVQRHNKVLAIEAINRIERYGHESIYDGYMDVSQSRKQSVINTLLEASETWRSEPDVLDRITKALEEYGAKSSILIETTRSILLKVATLIEGRPTAELPERYIKNIIDGNSSHIISEGAKAKRICSDILEFIKNNDIAIKKLGGDTGIASETLREIVEILNDGILNLGSAEMVSIEGYENIKGKVNRILEELEGNLNWDDPGEREAFQYIEDNIVKVRDEIVYEMFEKIEEEKRREQIEYSKRNLLEQAAHISVTFSQSIEKVFEGISTDRTRTIEVLTEQMNILNDEFLSKPEIGLYAKVNDLRPGTRGSLLEVYYLENIRDQDLPDGRNVKVVSYRERPGIFHLRNFADASVGMNTVFISEDTIEMELDNIKRVLGGGKYYYEDIYLDKGLFLEITDIARKAFEKDLAGKSDEEILGFLRMQNLMHYLVYLEILRRGKSEGRDLPISAGTISSLATLMYSTSIHTSLISVIERGISSKSSIDDNCAHLLGAIAETAGIKTPADYNARMHLDWAMSVANQLLDFDSESLKKVIERTLENQHPSWVDKAKSYQHIAEDIFNISKNSETNLTESQMSAFINEWRNLNPVFPVDINDIAADKGLYFRKGTTYGSRYNWMSSESWPRDELFHSGIDIVEYVSAREETTSISWYDGVSVKAVIGGTVVFSDDNMVIIVTEGDKVVVYKHVVPLVQEGSIINAGGQIAEITGAHGVLVPHLHLAVMNNVTDLPRQEDYDGHFGWFQAMLKWNAEKEQSHSFDPLLLWPDLTAKYIIESDDSVKPQTEARISNLVFEKVFEIKNAKEEIRQDLRNTLPSDEIVNLKKKIALDIERSTEDIKAVYDDNSDECEDVVLVPTYKATEVEREKGIRQVIKDLGVVVKDGTVTLKTLYGELRIEEYSIGGKRSEVLIVVDDRIKDGFFEKETLTVYAKHEPKVQYNLSLLLSSFERINDEERMKRAKEKEANCILDLYTAISKSEYGWQGKIQSDLQRLEKKQEEIESFSESLPYSRKGGIYVSLIHVRREILSERKQPVAQTDYELSGRLSPEIISRIINDINFEVKIRKTKSGRWLINSSGKKHIDEPRLFFIGIDLNQDPPVIGIHNHPPGYKLIPSREDLDITGGWTAGDVVPEANTQVIIGEEGIVTFSVSDIPEDSKKIFKEKFGAWELHIFDIAREYTDVSEDDFFAIDAAYKNGVELNEHLAEQRVKILKALDNLSTEEIYEKSKKEIDELKKLGFKIDFYTWQNGGMKVVGEVLGYEDGKGLATESMRSEETLLENIERKVKAYHQNEKEFLLPAARTLRDWKMNMHIDLSSILKAGLDEEGYEEQVKQNAENLARQMLYYRMLGLKNVRYILENDPENTALKSMKKLIEEKRLPDDLAEALTEILRDINKPYEEGDFYNIRLMNSENLDSLKSVLQKGVENEFIVALEDDLTLEGVVLPNFKSAAAIGLALAALGRIKEKESIEDYEREKAKYFKKIKAIYERVGKALKDDDFSIIDLEYMVSGCSRNKLEYALRYALPPLAKDLIDRINQYHEQMRLFLMAA